MKDDADYSYKRWHMHHKAATSGAMGGLYFLGLIGAIFFYERHVTSLWIVILGILKSLIWPSLVVYHLLQFLSR